jgi:glycoside/pentoside/hexuronide:cation symporter, GPH family
MKAIMVFMPMAGFTVAGLALLLNPLRRGVHEGIVEELRAGRYHADARPMPAAAALEPAT